MEDRLTVQFARDATLDGHPWEAGASTDVARSMASRLHRQGLIQPDPEVLAQVKAEDAAARRPVNDGSYDVELALKAYADHEDRLKDLARRVAEGRAGAIAQTAQAAPETRPSKYATKSRTRR